MSENSEKNNLLNFIAATVEEMRDQMDQMATKTDVQEIRDQMATKNDLLATRDYLEAQITAVRGDIEQVHLRLDSIEKTLAARLTQIEAEVSRLRSVVYMLVKDRPELLRLLG